jgi:XisI protein
MNRLNTYRQIIRTVLKPYADISYANVNVKNHQIFDPETDRYLILSEGWERQTYLHSCLGCNQDTCKTVPRNAESVFI